MTPPQSDPPSQDDPALSASGEGDLQGPNPLCGESEPALPRAVLIRGLSSACCPCWRSAGRGGWGGGGGVALGAAGPGQRQGEGPGNAPGSSRGLARGPSGDILAGGLSLAPPKGSDPRVPWSASSQLRFHKSRNTPLQNSTLFAPGRLRQEHRLARQGASVSAPAGGYAVEGPRVGRIRGCCRQCPRVTSAGPTP